MSHYVKFNFTQLGMAFMTVLIFMQIIAMLSLCAVESVLLEKHMAYDFYQHSVLFRTAEYGLRRAEQARLDECMIPVTAVETLLAQPLAWWQSNATCTGIFQRFKYYYVTEFLGNDACAYVLPDKKNTADYFRVTLLAVDHTGNNKVFLQTTLVKPNLMPANCTEIGHAVQAGRQSWKEIN